jgi:choline kinase
LKLIIIAAGQGSRLRSITEGIPKSLSFVHGRTIIDTLLQNCKVNDIKDIVLVIGYNGSMIKDYLVGKWSELNIQFVENEQWNLENGLSVLKAKKMIPQGEDFMISMSDHLYFSGLLKKVRESSLSNHFVNVGVDLKVDNIFDYLELVHKTKECSLSNACGELIIEKKLGGLDIGKSYWLDIDTPEALKHAKADSDLRNKVQRN